MKEIDLYKTVKEFLKEEFNCFHTELNMGTKSGQSDVVGLRNADVVHNNDTVGDLGNDTEVISVEVKLEGNASLKSLGQAYAYSIMADRCYLAVHKPNESEFSDQEKNYASKLGVGLIKIGAQKECSIIISSPTHSPLRSHKLALVNRLGYVRCIMCDMFFVWKEDRGVEQKRENIKPNTIKKAIEEEKSFCYWLYEFSEQGQRKDERAPCHDRRYICTDCVQALSGLSNSNSQDESAT